MSLASSPASRWAVSARTNGEVLTAGISRAELELTVLGVPGGFSQLEIEGWLHDLAGVAVETSKADRRARALPALMHHALTGLLFSHAELWDRLETPRPCSSAFVDLPEGAAFGWVGEARVHVLVDGDPVEPHWVRVRDEQGREARAAVFAPGSDVVVTLEYWPGGEGSGAAPASLEAEWVNVPETAEQHEPPAAASESPAEPVREVTPAWFASAAVETSGAEPPPAAAATGTAPAPAAAASASAPATFEPAPAAFAAQPYPELPESLPVQQPGLAPAAIELERGASGVPELVVPLPRAEAAAGGTMDALREDEPRPAWTSEPVAPAPVRDVAQPRQPHPVARWLARVMNWGRPEPPVEPPLPEPEPVVSGAPVSAYDSLLSESVPPTSIEQSAPEQTALELPASSPAAAAPAAPAAGPLRPAGIAEILGAHATVSPAPAVAAAPAAAPAASPSGSIAINEKLQALLREIEAAEAAAMPVISPELPAEAARRPLEIDHEPVGADEAGFAIPRLPSSLQVGPREEDRFTAIPPLPTARSRVASLSEFDSPVPPPTPARLETEPVAVAPVEPPVPAPVAEPPLQVEPVAPPVQAAPPAQAAPLQVEPVAPLAQAAPLQVEPVAPPVRAVPPLPVPVEPPASMAPLAQPAPPAPVAPPVLRVTLPARDAVAAEPEVAAVASVTVRDSAPPAATAPAAGPEAEDAEPLFPQVPRRARSLEGPEPDERPKFRLPPRAGLWAAGVVVVFVLGWLVGGLAHPGADRGGPVMAALRAIGLGGARFTLTVNSSPGGAQIEVDGKAQTTRTPATLELPPGDHVVRLVMPGLGAVEVPVKGRGGETLSIDESLNGRLEILGTDSKVPISVSIDGKPAGYAPLEVESIAPGLHEVGFSGPGMPAWAQTVQVGVRGTAQLVARPMTAPANGVIQAQATLNDERGASPLQGAQVYVDGELRGVTPLSLELPRGPHSLRVTWRGETAPVQVIDLPGGNQRFASFQLGLDTDAPRLTPIGSTKTFPAGQPKVVSASVEGLEADDVREAWLHVRTPEGLWRRYAMTVMRGAGGLVVTSVFPDNVFDKQGTTRWYVRVVTPQGDEVFSEVQRSALAGN